MTRVADRIVILLMLVAGACAGEDAASPSHRGDETDEGSGASPSGTGGDRGAASGSSGGMSASGTSDSGAGGSASSASDSGAGGASSSASDSGVDGGASPGTGGSSVTAVELAPELLEIWYFGWNGSNFSFFQIGLCADGVATYLFANSPNDPNPKRYQGHYVAHDVDRLTADFRTAAPPDTADLVFELEYDAGLDRLRRAVADDGYDSHGVRFSEFAWSEPAATCP
jgi:hypothetical protein